MSFMGGSACSAGSNPLSQMAKQQSIDRTHQFEKSQQQAPGQASLRGDMRHMSASDRQLLQSMDRASSGSFKYGDMRQELATIGRQAPFPGPAAQGSEWSKDFNAKFAGAAPPAAAANSQWATEFSQGSSSAIGPAIHAQAGPSTMPHMGYGMPSMMMGSMRPMAAQPQMHETQAKITELPDSKWEEHFKEVESQSSKAADKQSEGKEKEDQGASETRQDDFVRVEDILDEREIGIEDGYDPSWFERDSAFPPGWEDVWSRIKDQVTDNDMTTGGRMHAGDFTHDFERYAGTRSRFAEYTFAEENPYLQEDDPFQLGVSLMDRGAKLSLAVLCFEAALQRDRNHVEAWSRLGAAQAQNECEDAAIRALEQCVKLDQTNEQALMNLAVSYTNEGYENAAYATLERWLATKYPSLASQVVTNDPNLDRLELHAKVTGLFIKAAQMSPDTANMDVDVQTGLGVLFYGNEEYEKAIDCFRAALAARPDDALLWNRLGATLANSNRPEEAIEAYYKALELRPSFVRARYNVGVSCINIGCYREAVEHLLSALSLHDTGPGDTGSNSSNLYDTLRRVFLAMDRRDLIAKVGPGMNLAQFRDEFQF